MQFQFNVTPPIPATPPEAPAAVPSSETIDVLRQILDVQRQQLTMLQTANAMHDHGSRWRAFLTRWRDDFPDLGVCCREVFPVLERTYGAMLTELADHIRENGAPDNDFSLQEFLDRFGMRLAQLGTIVNLVGPLADAASQGENP